MLLVFDVGNTHVVFGVFKGNTLLTSWRLQSDVNRTVDEYALEILWLVERGLREANFELEANDHRLGITGIAICCVVPPLARVFGKFSQKYFGFEALIVSSDLIPEMFINTENPESVGADRLINAFAARESYGFPGVVVDMGTATTFDVIGSDGSYEGGIISPGLNISAQALFSRAAMLPSIQIKHPKSLIGKNTREAMLSGIVYGYVGLVDGIVSRIKNEMKCESLIVIGTGGLVTLVADDLKIFHRIVPDLTLQGLRIVAERNGLGG